MNGIGAKTGNMPPSPNDNAQCKLSGWESCGDAQLLSLYIEEKEKREQNTGHTSGWYDEHYQGDIQPIEYMQAQFSKQEFIGGLLFNIIKDTRDQQAVEEGHTWVLELDGYFEAAVEVVNGEKEFSILPKGEMKTLIKSDAANEK